MRWAAEGDGVSVPFPGTGQCVRILGEVTAAAAETLRHADAIFIEELRKVGWYEKTSQAFAVFCR